MTVEVELPFRKTKISMLSCMFAVQLIFYLVFVGGLELVDYQGES